MSPAPLNPDIVSQLRSAEPGSSEALLRAVFDNIGVGISIVDHEGRFLGANAALQHMFGYTWDELSSMTFNQITHPEDAARTYELFQRMIRQGRDRYQTEKRYLRKDGKVVWGSVNASILRNAAGEVAYSIALVEDITRRKEAAAALKASEQRFRAVFETAGTGIVISGTDGVLQEVNTAFAEMLGYTPDQLHGRHFTEITHPDCRQDNAQTNQRLVAGEFPSFIVEKRYLHKDGGEVWANTTVSLVRNDAGLPQFTLAMTHDITARKVAELALRHSEERYRTLFEATPTGLLVEDDRGHIVDVNQAVVDTLGYTRDELIGRHVSMLNPSYELDMQENVNRVLAGEKLNHEVRNLRADGSERTIELIETRILLPDGRHGILVVSQDVTERRASEFALRTSEEQTRQLAERLKVLFGELDHRVRNNLAGLVTLVSMYAQDKPQVRAFASAVEGKLMAMKHVHELIASGNYRSVVFEELMSDLCRMYGVPAKACLVRCPQLWITPRQAGPVAMVLHEMLTNSHKHGALSAPTGVIVLVSEVESETDLAVRVRLDWTERGVGGEPPADSTGQGLQLIRGLVEFDLRGSSAFEFKPEGLDCRLVIELDKPEHV